MNRGGTPPLTLLEGYYGVPWGADERSGTLRLLADHGYGSYIYAPKADAYLRRRWREDHPADAAGALAAVAADCRDAGLRFGVGLSPYEIFRGFDDQARAALARKLAFLDELAIDDLAILFDDMRGDSPDLARRQVEVVEWVAGQTRADRLFVCPTYYSDDPVLDRAFGQRPPGYLETLGRDLDPAIHLFWTGPEVVSREITPGHAARVADALRRRPFLWDNYPVNDGQRMSRYLHLRAFTGRPATLADEVAGHAVNPALQPTLSRIPALTLVESYRRGNRYDYGQAFRSAAELVLGAELAAMVREDILTLQDVGLERLGDDEKRLRRRYAPIDHPGAREILAWLDGEYGITDEIVRTQ